MHSSAVNAVLSRCRAMVSRKKVKGKARRKAAAKAKAAAVEESKLEAVEESAAFKTVSSTLAPFMNCYCTHGWDQDEYDESHDCFKFIETVMEVFRDRKPTKKKWQRFEAACEATREKYPEIWCDSTKLKWIASAFVSIGARSVIHTSKTKSVESSADIRLSTHSVCFSEWIQQYVACALHNSVPLYYKARILELRFADERRILGFLKKRIPCSCLDELYAEMKHLPKMGLCGSLNCSHPDRKVEISKMWSCEACRRGHYCSKECQTDHWLSHKEDCKVWSEWEAVHGSSNQAE